MTPDQITEARALVERLDGYTPGPWVLDCWDILGEGPGTGNVCEVSIPNGVDDKYWKPGEPDNNAALIAAAPDLHAALTAALDEIERLRGENATLRTEKHADAEAIGALRGALSAMLDLQDNASPFGGEMYQDRVDRVFDQCREALKGADQ